MSIQRYFNLFLNKGGRIPMPIHANQYDSGEEWIFTLFKDDGTQYVPTAGGIIGMKSDGHAIADTGTVDSQGRVVITETTQMTAAAGINIFEIVLNGVHGTANFAVVVEPRPADEDSDYSESDLSLISQAIEMAVDSNTVKTLGENLEREISNRQNSDSNLSSEIAVERARIDNTVKTLGENLEREISNRQNSDSNLSSEIAVERARIDNIASLPSGSTTGDAELIDIRVGAEGATYSTAGDAVRGQISNLTDSLNDFKNEIIEQVNVNSNVFYENEWSNIFISASTGIDDGANNKYVSYNKKIYINETDILTYENLPNYKTAFVLYYSDNSYLGYRIGLNGVPYSGTTSIRIEFRFETDTTPDVMDSARLYINKGKNSKEIIAEIDEKIENVSEKLEQVSTLVLPYTIGKIFSVVINDLFNYSSGKYAVIERGNISAIYVSAKFNKNFPPVVYLSGGTPSPSTYISSNNCGVTSSSDLVTVTDYLVDDIPSNCTHILLQSSIENNYSPLFRKKDLVDFTELGKLIDVNLTDGELSVITDFGDSNINVIFGKRGVNNIADFKYIYVGDTLIYGNSTDWHSPLVVGAINNIDGGHPYNQYFTGGNHAYDNSGTGVASGRTSSLKYYIDGKEVSEFSGKCNHISIEWTNLVQGYNTEKEDGTGREIIQENHRMDFDGYEWTSCVEYIALEDITFKRLYGFQCAGTATAYPNIRFISGENRGLYSGTENCNSGNKSCNLFEAYGTLVKLEMELDPTIDAGDRRFYTGTEGCFNNDYGKAYFYIISNTNFNSGDVVAIRGKYRFLPVIGD